MVALRNSGHLGRIGDWAEMAAAAGLVSLHFVNTSGGGILVAPFGGTQRRLSANPIAAGVPVANGPPIIVDISTCTIAEGKIKVAFNKGAKVPDGCILDAEGRPDRRPEGVLRHAAGSHPSTRRTQGIQPERPGRGARRRTHRRRRAAISASTASPTTC